MQKIRHLNLDEHFPSTSKWQKKAISGFDAGTPRVIGAERKDENRRKKMGEVRIGKGILAFDKGTDCME